MPNFKAWISAARLRTLPLSVSGIIVGSSLAMNHLFWQSSIFWLAILTTIGFQVLSNFANDYGDGIKGADDNREGEQRMVSSGLISPKQMKTGILITAIFSMISAIVLIYYAFGAEDFLHSLLFFMLGIASVIAALKYTIGENAYGYSGLGDGFVFLFFGLLSVLGSYYLLDHQMVLDLLLPASTIGFLSMAVLNLNNMRDIENDAKNNKNTLVVSLGSSKAKIYHYVLICLAVLLTLLYSIINDHSIRQLIYVIAFIPLMINLVTVYKNKEPKLLDSELKKVALSTFSFALLFGFFH
ncbi:1,4-dihydroxy-2-naphthoate octaprenyltransferase [Flavobacteriaceae bacterium]|jgi:1,4-dihydroxy-2-naphthoate octaprenyltransferase|nr:1,4-dihydroxy-2-naphthoate octaprenyltransferase [Flavobacteriaceae bacterium]MDB9913070.1 1,4-dihydroxy-2-naphthoate octaprenyltransferase [Flavobacteriaceae bacterium]MDB9993363.1 1,4-dihydroxy-2-naphthoate octaprenyltransferase [Flavobacteriaceae bacterium]MDG1329018.1 1,4-dihydroxy-2-naphthoate octaprenyltransferase [Flavobacteriaceae bacterium]